MSVRLIVIALLLASGAPQALAAGRTDQPPRPCKADFDKFCAGKVVCGKGACHDCLNAHMADLHRACSKAMGKWDEKQEQR